MKVRHDFVTNSSSSSFILGFTSEDDIEQTLSNDKCCKYLETIYEDCIKAEKINMDNMLEAARKEMKWNVRFEIEYEMERKSNKSWEEIFEWTKSKEFEDIVEKEIQRRLDDIKAKAEKNNNQVFVDISYSDECGESELEHEIVPFLGCCLASFSHH